MKLLNPTSYKFHFNNNFSENILSTEDYRIIQIGDLLCDSRTVVPNHRQLYDLEITFIAEGEGDIYTDGIPAKAGKGYIYLSFRNDIHKIVSSKNSPLRYYFLTVDFINEEMKKSVLNPVADTCKSAEKRLIYLPDVFPKMVEILQETKYINKFSPYILQSYITQIAISVNKKIIPFNLPHPRNDINLNGKSKIIYNIVNYIDINCTSIHSPSEIAEIYHYNYQYISRLFKKTVNMTVREYLCRSKMYKARTLLESGKSASEVSDILGYSSVNNFSRAFFREFGFYPSEHKKL